jgi:SAM-dependent methyltransferase
MSLKSSIVAQFGKPSGLWGALAGRIMASRPSNRFRNARTVELLQLTPVSRVLEIGCGPGLALANCAQIITSGRIVGLDHSGVMIRQARDRLERAGAAHRAELVEGGIDRLRDWPGYQGPAFTGTERRAIRMQPIMTCRTPSSTSA